MQFVLKINIHDGEHAYEQLAEALRDLQNKLDLVYWAEDGISRGDAGIVQNEKYQQVGEWEVQ